MKKILASRKKSKTFRKHGIPPRGTREFLSFMDNMNVNEFLTEEELGEHEKWRQEEQKKYEAREKVKSS